ncbi:MAG TPA: ribosome biogenesis GTPase Der [Gemmatimonadota bacterium]|nr:ribosome biogenesis GTPase Der [Gemmatimonadota bacterium]
MQTETRDERSAPPAGRRPTVAIVGRPNVGKSTLFNRILGHRLAIVAERAGVTRDRQFAPAAWSGRDFVLVDTGGLVEAPDRPMESEIRRQVLAAIEHSDAILFVVDGRTGLHPVDEHIAGLLRRSGLPVLLAVNKVDEPVGSMAHLDFFRLGLGDPVPVSALSGKGSGDLLDRLLERLPPRPADAEAAADELGVAVIGKPNVGKSSFVNRLLGEERVIVHEEAGTTRDAIDTFLEFRGRPIRLVDTAGLRRRARVDDDVEFYSRVRATSAIRRADVCLLLVDCSTGAGNQDFRIGQEAWDAGCGLVFVANKWDLVEERGPDVFDAFVHELRERAAYLRWVPILTASARTGRRVRTALELALEVAENRERRIPTAEVNQVLGDLTSRRQPPQGGRGDVRIYYGSQVSTSPPTFVLWVNRPSELASHYVRYIENGFRDAWDFEGTPIRIRLKRRGGDGR